VTWIRPHVAGKLRTVVAGGLGAKLAIHCRVQPAIEVFIRDQAGLGARPDLRNQGYRFGLCRGKFSLNYRIKVDSLAGRGVPSLAEAYQAGIGLASDDSAPVRMDDFTWIMTENKSAHKRFNHPGLTHTVNEMRLGGHAKRNSTQP
jgi:hypothetical protein